MINGRLHGTGERLPKAKLVLETLEHSLAGNKQVATKSQTIEHMMPQTPTPWWEESLGETWRETHGLKLHTLGNLTLTGYNAELSNGDFSAKRAVFLHSPIYLTQSIKRFEKWDGETIQQRGEKLADVALKTWPCFGTPDSLFSGASTGGHWQDPLGSPGARRKGYPTKNTTISAPQKSSAASAETWPSRWPNSNNSNRGPIENNSHCSPYI